MNVRNALQRVLDELPEDRLSQILEFAMFVSERDEREAWREFGQAQFARAYGENEPDYSLADVKPECSE